VAKHVKGRKRHLLVDTLGLMWGVLVTAADMTDREGALRLLLMLRGIVHRLQRIWADGGYRGAFIDTVQRLCRWTVEIILRSDAAKGFEVLPKRWIVEPTFAWLLNFRRLSKDYEYLLLNSTGMIYAAMIRLMLRRFAA
jgi:putative transposase